MWAQVQGGSKDQSLGGSYESFNKATGVVRLCEKKIPLENPIKA